MKTILFEPKISMVASKKNTAVERPVKKRKKISPILDLRKHALRLGSKIKKTFVRQKRVIHPTSLSRFQNNPVIEPSTKHYWESKATFNPSALYANGKVHLIYRAIGEGDVSVFGYAVSKDGLRFSKRNARPAFFQTKTSHHDYSASPALYLSGGGWNGGSEDPRLTKIGDRVYMLYTAFDGWNSVRISLTSISFEDFIHERWHWEKPVFISPPGEINKNWVLFPEKIDGKYAILHGISPYIGIDYVEDLRELDGTKYIRSAHPNGTGNAGSWDTSIRGVGPAPIKTKYGWLILYHAMDVRDPNRYKLGAMILDLNDPTKIIARASQPILEPDEWYENEGFKAGVVYACGAAVVDGKLFVYYGGADTVVCVATANFDLFLKDVMASGVPKVATSAK